MFTTPNPPEPTDKAWSPGRPLVYLILFCSVKYLTFAGLLLESLHHLGQYCGDVLFITEPALRPSIQALPSIKPFHVHYHLLGPCPHSGGNPDHTRLRAAITRARVFDFPAIHNFSMLLYLDTDIVVVRPLRPFLAGMQRASAMSVMPEYTVCSQFHAAALFSILHPRLVDRGLTNLTLSAFLQTHLHILGQSGCKEGSFNSGLLLVPNTHRMRWIFQQFLAHAQEWMRLDLPLPKAMEQPFLTFQVLRHRAAEYRLAQQHVQLENLAYYRFLKARLLPTATFVHFSSGTATKLDLIRGFLRRNGIHVDRGAVSCSPTA
eukprot:GGOE01004049.1.p1 GENE.GGOE01004049.1~~GGOE01004049.1.p1  ORF type:complete len:319 (-),score=84.75 GGOE01004049.1:353-1309(-)